MVYLNKIEGIANQCYDELGKGRSDFQDKMVARSKRKYSAHGEEELKQIKFVGIPVLIVGNKFDLLHKMHNL